MTDKPAVFNPLPGIGHAGSAKDNRLQELESGPAVRAPGFAAIFRYWNVNPWMRIPQAGAGCRAMNWQVIEFDFFRGLRVGCGVCLLIRRCIGVNHEFPV